MLITPQELEIHKIVISKTYGLGALDYHGAEFQQLGELKVAAAAELVASEIRIRGRLETRLGLVCDRCLGPVELPAEGDFDLYYRPVEAIAREKEVELPEDELEVGFYSGEGVMLEDVITEQVILLVPMKVVCQPNCRGLCPSCGANLNSEQCRCQAWPHKLPFAALE